MRKCVGCGTSRPKQELIRIAAQNEKLNIDIDGKAPGRGVYVCPNRDCIEKASKNNGFKRSLKKNIETDVLKKLFEELDEYERKTL